MIYHQAQETGATILFQEQNRNNDSTKIDGARDLVERETVCLFKRGSSRYQDVANHKFEEGLGGAAYTAGDHNLSSQTDM